MAINFPISLDALANPTATSDTNLVDHALQHSNENDAVEALEAKVGVNSSAVTSSLDYKINHLTASSITDVTATFTEINYTDGVTSSIQTQLNTLTSDKVPKTTTVNGHALSGNISVTASDVGLGNVDNTSDATKNSASVTLTSKEIEPRVVSSTSYTTDTGTSLTVATADQFDVTAQAGALKLNNPGGSPVDGQKIIVRIKDNGTARVLTYDTQFRAIGVTLPTTTVISKTVYLACIFNTADTKWDVLAVGQEA